MNNNYPESSDQHNLRSGKLVLPGYNDSTLPASDDAKTTYIPMGQSPSSPYDSPVRPEMLMQNYASSSAYPSGKLKPRSRSSPAQLILLIAIIVVVIATGSVAYAAVTLVGPSLTKSSSGATQANSSAANTQASATALPTATPMPSPTPKPITTFDGAPLTLTIQDLPNSVDNDSGGPVTVQTNASGIPVHLQVTYSVTKSPFSYTSDTQMTDDQGVATLTWNVQINPTKRRTNAKVVAIAQEPNGQTVQSDPVNVKINR